jgi:hypothetical protein
MSLIFIDLEGKNGFIITIDAKISFEKRKNFKFHLKNAHFLVKIIRNIRKKDFFNMIKKRSVSHKQLNNIQKVQKDA